MSVDNPPRGGGVILDGRMIGQTLNAPAADPRALLLALYPEAQIPPLSHVVATAAPLVAHVNHGRWIASCACGARGLPRPGCVVWLDQAVGWCVRCGNQAWGGGWRPITVPDEAMRQQIEAVLLCRPNVGDRNWEPDETVADLIAQNREHGDRVPDLAALAGPEHGPTWREIVAPFSPLPKLPTGRLRRLAERVRVRR